MIQLYRQSEARNAKFETNSKFKCSKHKSGFPSKIKRDPKKNEFTTKAPKDEDTKNKLKFRAFQISCFRDYKKVLPQK